MAAKNVRIYLICWSLGKTGLMVEINDHEALAREAMSLLEDNDLAQKLINNGREAVAKFSWEEVQTKWLSIYEELSNRR